VLDLIKNGKYFSSKLKKCKEKAIFLQKSGDYLKFYLKLVHSRYVFFINI